MGKIKGVEIGILASTSMRDRETARRFLELLLHVAPQYAPDRYDDHEPIRRLFNPTNLDEALDCWGDAFLWYAKKRTVSGGAYVGFQRVHDAAVLRMPISALEIAQVRRLFAAFSAAFGIDLAFVHIRTDADITDREYYRQHLMPFQTLNTHHLREGLPDMPWAMLFGPPYIELFGRERLLTTPAARVEPIGDGIYVQLTGDPADVAKKRDEYLAAQRTTKEHLDRDAFREMSPTRKCRVPDFFLVTH